jgi:uncharacterized protein
MAPHSLYSAPPFAERLPWIGGDLQTLRNFLMAPRSSQADESSENIMLGLGDGTGDSLLASLDRSRQARQDGALVVLIHGLTGCAQSRYMLASAAFWLTRGHAVLRLNLRGAGPSAGRSRELYNAGRSDDIARAIAAVPAELTQAGIYAIGYSLGGAILLKFLGEAGRETLVRAAASVSAPIDLAAASARLLSLRNRLYHNWLLPRMKAEAKALTLMSSDELAAIEQARTIVEYDDGFVAPRNGYKDAADYYAQSSAERFLTQIGVPTLVLSAANDPWIPIAAYDAIDWRAAPAVTRLSPAGGGHVGFHGRGSRRAWHDLAIEGFFAFTRARENRR